MSSKLHFQNLYNKDGFTNPHIQDKSKSDLEIVVRELLQNSLDEGSSRVAMRVVEVPVKQMPDFEGYREAFLSACKFRKERLEESHVERGIADRIRKILDSGKVSVLLCADNGRGIAEANMQSLLWAGNTNKGKDTGTGGSFGVGHCATFRVSDLRFVVYGTRTSGGVELEAGSAFIAAHSIDGEVRTPGGLYLESLPDSDRGEPVYSMPTGLMRKWLDEFTGEGLIEAGGTGTVVAVFGFSFEGDAVKEICEASAKNFYEALHSPDFSVNVQDFTGKKDRVLKDTLMAHLRNASGRTADTKKGVLRGDWALSQYRTFCEGNVILDDKDVTVRLRRWSQNEYGGGSPRDVAVCRTGMWIARTWEVPMLKPRDFVDVHPFSCVVSVKNGGSLAELVMKAEGPEHIGLPYLQEMSKNDREKLTHRLGEIAKVIKKAAGKLDPLEEFMLPDFAVLDAGQTENAERMKDKPLPSPTPDPTEPPAPNPDPTPKPFTDKPFTSFQSSIIPVDNNGKTEKLSCYIKIDAGSELPERLGLQIVNHGGSDATCSSWLPSTAMKLRSVQVEGNAERYVPEADGSELVFISVGYEAEMIVDLKDPVDTFHVANTLRLKAVTRVSNPKVADK